MGGIGSPNGWNDGFVIGMDDDDSVDLALDHRLNLLVLLIVIQIGNRLQHGPAA